MELAFASSEDVVSRNGSLEFNGNSLVFLACYCCLHQWNVKRMRYDISLYELFSARGSVLTLRFASLIRFIAW